MGVFSGSGSQIRGLRINRKSSISHFSPLFSTLENKKGAVNPFFKIFFNGNKGLAHFLSARLGKFIL